MCEQGQIREKTLERDKQPFHRTRFEVVSFQQVNQRYMPGSRVPMLIPETVYQTMPGQLPFGLPTLYAKTVEGFHWQLFQALLKANTFGRGKEAESKARKFATGVTFAHIGSRDSAIMPFAIRSR